MRPPRCPEPFFPAPGQQGQHQPHHCAYGTGKEHPGRIEKHPRKAERAQIFDNGQHDQQRQYGAQIPDEDQEGGHPGVALHRFRPLQQPVVAAAEQVRGLLDQQLRIAAIDPVIVPVFGDVHAEKGRHKHSPLIIPARPGSGGSWAEIPLKTGPPPAGAYPPGPGGSGGRRRRTRGCRPSPPPGT